MAPIRQFPLLVVVVVALTTLAACGDAPPPEPAPGCNPLVGGDCVTPLPSSFFEVADATTMTGRRIQIAADALPQQASGARLSAERANRADGFSPAMPLLVYLPGTIDEGALPSETALAQSLAPTATVQLYDLDSGERVALWAELDGNAAASERRALLIHPARPLAYAAHYGVALVGIGDAPRPFVAIRDGKPLSNALATIAPATRATIDFFVGKGIARSAITLAWDFHTRSEDDATRSLYHMRDVALTHLPELGYAITGTHDGGADQYLHRSLTATVDVPSFLASTDLHAPLQLGSDGLPTVRGIDKVPVDIIVPRCAETAPGPIPLVIFGTGLFLSAHETLPGWRYVIDQVCAVYVGTDWIGLAMGDLPLAGEAAVSNLDLLNVITDRLQQAHVNVLLMTRIVRDQMKNDPALAVGGHPAFDGSQVYYFGISNGGIQGVTQLAINDVLTRGVLNVPGCEWSLMLSRSTDFVPFKNLLSGLLPDALDQEIAFVLAQGEWDHTDAATYAAHVTQPVLVQEAIGDAQVANAATRVLVRALGVPALSPLAQPVFGVDEKAGPLDSAYTQWDPGVTPLPPLGNVALPMDNGAHNSIWPSALSAEQLRAFYKPDGKVTQVCDGICKP